MTWSESSLVGTEAGFGRSNVFSTFDVTVNVTLQCMFDSLYRKVSSYTSTRSNVQDYICEEVRYVFNRERCLQKCRDNKHQDLIKRRTTKSFDYLMLKDNMNRNV